MPAPSPIPAEERCLAELRDQVDNPSCLGETLFPRPPRRLHAPQSLICALALGAHLGGHAFLGVSMS